jgi:predicted membrane-bound dolichyl-phosphate-mannose-protein mannosyltransferase
MLPPVTQQHPQRAIPLAAGIAIGLAALSKEMGIIGLPILLTFLLLEHLSSHTFKMREFAKLAAKVLIGFALPLGLLGGAVALFWHLTPAQQIANIFTLAGIKVDHYNADGSYVLIGAIYPESSMICPPWLWILNRNEIKYFDGTVGSLTVRYMAAMNPLVIYLMLPAVAYSIWHFSKTRNRSDLFDLVWWAWAYVIVYPLAFAGRAMYIFYMIPAMGAVSLMAASLLCHPSGPITSEYCTLLSSRSN